jgi:Rieske Fe-S protein
MLRGAALVAGAGVLSACGGDDTASTGTSSKAPGTPAATPASTPASTASTTAAAPPAAAPLAATGDIPVGGGKIFADEGVVITQPEKGTFKAFGVKCTHQGCPVSNIEGGTINCTCHGSKFALADGAVKGGPAKAPLEAVEVKVDGDSIVRA